MIPSCEMQTSISIERLLGHSGLGASPIFNAPAIVKGKYEPGSRRVTNNKGELILGNGTVFLPAGTKINVMDRLIIGGSTYIAIDVQNLSLMGREHHIEIIVQSVAV